MKIFVIALAMMLSTSVFAKQLVTLRTDNTLLLRGEISSKSIAAAQEQLVDLVNNRIAGDTIYIVIDSPGGDIEAGENFIQFAKVIGNVETISLFAASMASAIAEGLPGKRLIPDNGTLMFHRARGGFEGQFAEGEVESRLSYAKSIVSSLENRNSDRLGLSVSSYKRKVKDELWLYGNQAVEDKAADEMVDIVCSRQLLAQKIQTGITIMGLFDLTVEMSGCPLIKGMKLVGNSPKEKEALTTYMKTYTTPNGIR